MAYQRANESMDADIYRKCAPFARGTFKNVWGGTYTSGARAGQRCVAKEFKAGSVYEADYFDEELSILARAQGVIDAWHAKSRTDRKILLNTPQIWEYYESAQKTLVEPYIANFEKFNSNSGWVPMWRNFWGETMQALSHFSYEHSGGQFLLCDLQGGPYSDGYILCDPVIMSQLQDCGPADLGPEGIYSFFARHRCGRYCTRFWRRPRITGMPTVPMRTGTTMLRMATRPNRTPLSSFAE